MLMHYTPRSWFWILVGLLICIYIKLATTANQQANKQPPKLLPIKASISSLFH